MKDNVKIAKQPYTIPIPIALENAKFCPECEMIFSNSSQCPICGSKHWVYLSKWLNRNE